MSVCACVLLALVALWTGPASANKTPANVDSGPLLQWLSDPDAAHALRKAWGGSGSPLEAAYAAVAASPSSLLTATCKQDITHVLSTKTLAYMLDASDKIPPGIMEGSLTHLGHWDECVNVRDQRASPESEVFHGKMCLININTATSRSHPQSVRSAMDVVDQNGRIATWMSLRLGICVPSSCVGFDVENLFNAFLEQTIGKATLIVTVPDSECSTRDTPSLDASDWVAVGILSGLCALVLGSTAYDLIVSRVRKRNLLTAFSIVTNGKKLLAFPRSGGDTTLSCLHGIRVLSTLWVMLGHRYSTHARNMANINPKWLLDIVTRWTRVYVTNATLSVDSFLVLSGLLVGYIFFKQPPSSRRLNLLKYYIHRYVRLTPALAFVILLYSTLLIHMGWGPLWFSAMHLTRDICQETWWTSLLYVSNYVKPMKFCVSQSWYLMVDMQLYWLAPIVLLPLARVPRIGALLMIVLMCGGIISNFLVSYLNDLPGNMLAATDERAGKIFGVNYYIATYGRFVPYLEGLSLGYILGDGSARGVVRKPFPFMLAFVAWIAVAALLLVPLITGYLFLQDPLPSHLSAAFYNALHRPAWGLGLLGLVYLCALGNGGPVNTFLSWCGFQMVGRLCYCMYLIHIPLMVTQLYSMRITGYLSDSVILSAFASDVLICLVLATIMSLVFESPFLSIEKEIFGWKAQKRRSIKSPSRSFIEVNKSSDTQPEEIAVENLYRNNDVQ